MIVATPPAKVCYEDQACWDWRRMGNHCKGAHTGVVCAIVNHGRVVGYVWRARP